MRAPVAERELALDELYIVVCGPLLQRYSSVRAPVAERELALDELCLPVEKVLACKLLRVLQDLFAVAVDLWLEPFLLRTLVIL